MLFVFNKTFGTLGISAAFKAILDLCGTHTVHINKTRRARKRLKYK